MDDKSNVLNLIDQKPDPNFKKGRGYIYIVAGIAVLFLIFHSPERIVSFILGSVFLCLFGYAHIGSYEGVIFDFNRNCVKKYWALAGVEIGKWEQVLVAKMIVLDTQTTKSSVTNVVGRLDFQSPYVSQIFRICVSYKNIDKFDIIVHFRSYEKALENAQWLAKKLNMSIENRIQRNT
jgi:hypothetical protein